MPKTHETRFPLAVAAVRAGTTLAQLNDDLANGLVQADYARDGWGRPVAGRMTSAEVQRYRAEVIGGRTQEEASRLGAKERAKIEVEREHERGLLRERLARSGIGREGRS